MKPTTPLPLSCAALSVALMATACTGGSTVDEPVEGADAAAVLEPITVGYVSAIDQVGVLAATDQGFFDELGLEVETAPGFPTGVDAVNALESGEVDIIQVGVPGIVAISNDIDLTFVGHYSGSPTQRNIDDTLAIVAGEDSDIDPEDLETLRGKKIATSFGTINHLYVLAILRDLRIDVDEVTLVNTPPPDMPIALETDAVDAVVSWDPAPLLALEQVKGSYEVIRGGSYIPYVGYIAVSSTFLEESPDEVEAFLTARAASDQWMRQNIEAAAEAVPRWLNGTEPDIALAAMEYNAVQLDPRFSVCNYLAMDTVANLLEEQEVIEYRFTVSDHMDPSLMNRIVEEHPELFEDLPEIPEQALIGDDHNFVREADQIACEV